MLHQIGAGVLGPVFRAYQPDPGRLVAVKQFRLDLPPENAHRFVAALERLIAADLTHMGIAAPLAAGLTENTPYLALDFVAAESFDVVIRDYGPAPVTEALRIATQLGGALDFAAAVNVFHGALHPRDVLVSTDDTRVTGLGIAQALEQFGVMAPVRRPYTAPERVAGAAWDRRADTFSLAALVFEMLFGRRISGLGPEAADAITGIEGADAGALRALFARALAENPADRFDTALGFAEALHGVLSQPSRPAKVARTRRKRDTDAEPATPSLRGARPSLPLEPDNDLPLSLAPDEPPPLDLDAISAATPAADLPLALAASDPELQGSSQAFQAAHEQDAEPEPPSIAQPRGSDESESTAIRLSERVDDQIASVSAGRDELLEAHPHVDDLDLRNAEDDRYRFADSESALPDAVESSNLETLPAARAVVPAVDDVARRDDDESVMEPEAVSHGREASPAHSLSSAALEQSRSAVWPILLALVVGLSVGFAGGYGFFVMRDRANAGGTAVSSAASGGASASTSADARSVQPAPATPPATPRPSTGPGGSQGPANAEPTRPATPDAARRSAAVPAPPPEPVAPRTRLSAPPERTAVETGRIAVRSKPSGARVTVDGRDAGVTPLTLNEVARGVHVLRITHQGYVAAERRVRIGSTQTAQSIEVDLVATRAVREAAPPPAPERTSGSLMVDSRPAGARVFVDGKLVGTTPMLLDAVGVGDHAVRLELDGFNPWTATTKVTAGERIRVSGSLEQR